MEWSWCLNIGEPQVPCEQVSAGDPSFLSQTFAAGTSRVDFYTHHHFDFASVATIVEVRASASRPVEARLAFRHGQESYWAALDADTPWVTVPILLGPILLDGTTGTHQIPIELLIDPADMPDEDPYTVHVLLEDASDVDLVIEEIALVP